MLPSKKSREMKTIQKSREKAFAKDRRRTDPHNINIQEANIDFRVSVQSIILVDELLLTGLLLFLVLFVLEDTSFYHFIL